MTAVERKKLIINNIKDKEKNMKKTLTNEKSKQKVLFRYIYRGQLKERTLDIADIYAIISSKKYEKQVTSLREELIGDTSERELAETDAINNIPSVQTVPGMVVLSLPTSSQQQLEQLRSRVQLFPQLLMAFQSIDGRRLIVLMSYELSNGTLPVKKKDVRLFQQYAFRRAADFVLASTGIKVDEDDAAQDQQFYVSSDDKAIWNEQVVAVKMDQPTEELTEQTASIMSTPKEHPLKKGVLPGYTQLEMDIIKFNATSAVYRRVSAGCCRRLPQGRHRPGSSHKVPAERGQLLGQGTTDKVDHGECLPEASLWPAQSAGTLADAPATDEGVPSASLRIPQKCSDWRRRISGERTLHTELAPPNPGGSQRHQQCSH